MNDHPHEPPESISESEKRRLHSRLLRLFGVWGAVLSGLALIYSLIYAESFEHRVIVAALAVAAGFIAVASNVGPVSGFAAAVCILLGAMIGPIVFSAAIGATVALIGAVKLQRLKQKKER